MTSPLQLAARVHDTCGSLVAKGGGEIYVHKRQALSKRNGSLRPERVRRLNVYERPQAHAILRICDSSEEKH